MVCMTRCLVVMLLIFAEAATAAPQQGFNLLQVPAATFDHPAAAESMRRMVETGANAVILVPFLQQGRAGSAEIGFSDAVTDRQLHEAIENARRLGLRIILKPQVLVDDGWAGDIKFGSDADEERWFKRYRELIGYYARLAERERVDTFVIGTELSGIETSTRWRDVIASVRAVFHGMLTYAAHGVEGVKRFPAWRELDVVGVNLYPKLGDSADKSSIRARMDQTVKELEKLTREILRPVWVLEVGIPSAQGALESPWDWRRLSDNSSEPEPALQGIVLGQWLEALEKPWIEAVFIWCWYSDPYAGGMDDIDYTLQNKPAEIGVKCRWAGECGGVRK
jgi:hypothetical protein